MPPNQPSGSGGSSRATGIRWQVSSAMVSGSWRMRGRAGKLKPRRRAGFQPASGVAPLPPVAIGLGARMSPILAGWKLAATETRRLVYDSEALPAPVVAVHANQGTSFAGIAESIAAFDRDCVNAALAMRRGLSTQKQGQVPGDNPVRLGGIRRLVAADKSDPVDRKSTRLNSR